MRASSPLPAQPARDPSLRDANAAGSAAAPLARSLEALWLSAALALFTGLAALRAWDAPFPYYDDVAYLDTASRIRESGGLLALASALFRGRWEEANRNPLYLALLSLVAGRDTEFHRRAQALGIALGALALVAAWWAARQLFGARAALWVALFLACSETLVAWSSREACEPLLLVFAALAFERLLRDAPSLRALALGGFFSGLAWLCKGTGIFIAISACLALAWEAARGRAGESFAGERTDEASRGRSESAERSDIAKARVTRSWRAGRAALFRIGAVLAGFLLGGLPLLVRNLLRFHAPLYNVNDRFLWIDPLDDFSEIFAPGALARLDRGPLAYLRALTPTKALLRVGRGLGETLVHLGDSLSLVSPRPFGPVHIFWIAVGLAAAAASLRLIWRSPRGMQRTLFLVHAAFNFAFFAFYNAVSGSSRYLLPLALTLLFPLARALAENAAAQSRSPRPSLFSLRAWDGRALFACALAVVAAVALDPREHAPPPGFAAAFEAIRARVAPGEVFAIDARSRLQPYWAMDPRVKMETLSTSWDGRLLPVAEVVDALRARGVRWVVVDGTSRKGDEPRWFFSQVLPLAPDGSLPPGPLPAGLRLAWADPGSPRRFAILELEATSNK